jgi:hypothetical protein
MVNKKISWGFYAITLIITIAVFTSGIFFGIFLSSVKVGELQNSVSELEKKRMEQELNLLLADYLPNKTCDIMAYEVEEMIPQINELAREVTFYEETKKFEEKEYAEAKRDYTISQIRYWLYLERLKSSCNLNVTTLIYFYSNRDCDLCRDQGVVLDYVKNMHKSDLMIFAFDTDVELNSIEIIMKSYDIQELPSIIVDGELHQGFVGKDSLEDLI